MSNRKIVFQGEPGANSHIACRDAYPDYEAVPKATFEDCFQAVEGGEVELYEELDGTDGTPLLCRQRREAPVAPGQRADECEPLPSLSLVVEAAR